MATLEVQHVGRATEAGAPQNRTIFGVKVLRSISEIEEIRKSWMQLQRHPNADIDFYLASLPTVAELICPYVIVVYCDAAPLALLIGRLEYTRMTFKIGYSELLQLRARSLTFIYGGLLGDPDLQTCDLLVRQLIKALHDGDADTVFFNHLRADSPLCSSVSRLAGLLSRDYFPTSQTHRKMTMPGSAEEFWQRLSPKVRKNQQWQARKLLSNHSGAVRIDCFTQACELDRVLQDVEYVATKTYQRALGVGFRASAEMRRRLQLRIERGCFRGYVLYIENRPSAFWLGTVYNQDFHSDFMGYDPENAKYSPGMYLITNVIQDLCSHNKEVRKITAIDFGLGDAQYKEVLGNLEWQDVSIHLFGSTFRGRILQIVSLPMLLLDRAVRSVLRHWDLFSKVKKLWRRRAVLSLNASSREPSGHAKSTKSHNY